MSHDQTTRKSLKGCSSWFTLDVAVRLYDLEKREKIIVLQWLHVFLKL